MKKFLAPIFIFAIAFPASVLAITPNDPLIDEQWYLDKIAAKDAWDQQQGSDDIVVAILDSGVDYVHDDLLDNIWVNRGEIDGNEIDDDGNGYIDDVYGYDFVWDEPSPFPVIGGESIPIAVSHGTVIAGIIGAVGDNAEGITGINWDVSLMPLRILNETGSGTPNDMIDAVHYAVDNGADVINMSFAGYFTSDALEEAVTYAYEQGVVIVAAAGNDDVSLNQRPIYPICYSGEEDWVLGVSASDDTDAKADFSNFGSDCVDISAPGTDVFSVNYYDPPNGYDDEYIGGWDGTSLAAPMVSGAAALLLSAYPSMTPTDVMTVLKLSVDPLIGERRVHMGAGRLNIDSALELAEDMGFSTVYDPLSDMRFIRTEDSSSVYILPGDGTRRVVIDTQTFFTHRDDFNAVEIIDSAELSDYKLSGILLPKPESALIKIPSDPTVYWLEENPRDVFSPILRPIPSEDYATEQIGNDWADYVIDINQIHFSKFTSGLPVDLEEELDASNLIQREILNR